MKIRKLFNLHADFNKKELQTAYRRLSKKCHPNTTEYIATHKSSLMYNGKPVQFEELLKMKDYLLEHYNYFIKEPWKGSNRQTKQTKRSN